LNKMTPKELYESLYLQGYQPSGAYDKVKDLIQTPKTAKILDFGTGQGTEARKFLDDGWNVVGYDIIGSGYVKNLPEDRYFENVDGMKWDWLWSWDCLEHIPADEVDGVLARFYDLADKFHFTVCHRPSFVLGPDGSNLHPSPFPISWWEKKMEDNGILIKTVKQVFGHTTFSYAVKIEKS